MESNLLTGQRLRFEMQMDPRESIPGRIARGVNEHVLLWTRPVLEAAGVNLRHLGFSQLAAPDELERLAFVARCGVDELLANVGARKCTEFSETSLELKFGSHSFPSTYFERNRRRISPLSLRVGDFHRLDWMNLLLPYCPESGEHLTHECQACHAKLGWHYARGIGICEFCETEVAPSVQPHLPEHLADGYRCFAKLTSAKGQDVDDAFASLAPALRSSRRGTLIRLATMTGGLAQDGLVVTTSRRAVLDLSSEVRASVISIGVEFLRTWPHGFKSWVDERSEELRANREQLIRFRARLKRLAKAQLESEDLVDLILDSMPELREHAAHAFAKRRYYLYFATRTRLRLDNAQMKALRQWMGEGYRPSPTTGQFQKGQFDADVIDALSPVFSSVVPFAACSWRLKIPHYAVEQCCRPGLLTIENHPAFLAVRKARSVQSGSLDALVKNLIDKQSSRKKPKGTTSLSVAVKRIGGRLKPWASILQTLGEGSIEFWIDRDEPNSKSIHLHANEIAQFDRVVDDPDVTKITSTDTMSQLDAADILNIKPALVSVLAPKLGIIFIPVGLALVAPVREVLKVAEAVAWEKEVSWHLGIHHRKVEDVLTSLGIDRLLTGWSRSQLITAGILPTIDNWYSVRA